MSYSVCIKCSTMVPAYEKYCRQCVQRFRLPQDESFHKSNSDRRPWPEIVATDLAIPEPTLEVRCKCGEIYSQHMHTVCPNCFLWPSKGRVAPPSTEEGA